MDVSIYEVLPTDSHYKAENRKDHENDNEDRVDPDHSRWVNFLFLTGLLQF